MARRVLKIDGKLGARSDIAEKPGGAASIGQSVRLADQSDDAKPLNEGRPRPPQTSFEPYGYRIRQ
jgi:hypothetical protein